MCTWWWRRASSTASEEHDSVGEDGLLVLVQRDGILRAGSTQCQRSCRWPGGDKDTVMGLKPRSEPAVVTYAR